MARRRLQRYSARRGSARPRGSRTRGRPRGAASAAAAGGRGAQFTVVSAGARGAAGAPAPGQVQVMFSRPPQTADDVLRTLAVKGGAGTVVASSDRAVRDAARRAGAVAVSAEDFVAALRSEASANDEDDADPRADERG